MPVFQHGLVQVYWEDQEVNLEPPASRRSTTAGNRCEPPQPDIEALIALVHQGRFEQVRQRARRLAASFPGAAIIHNILGAAQAGLGDLTEATTCYRRALQIQPDYAEAYNNLANALQEQGRHDEAINCYAEALYIDPHHAEAHFNLGMALKATGRLQQAIAAFQRTLEICPDDAEAHFNLGILYRETGRLQEAAACYARALRYRPDHAEAHRNLSTLKRYRQGDPQIAQMRKLLGQPDLPEAQRMQLNFALGKAHDDLGEAATAFRHFADGNRLRRKALDFDMETERRRFARIKAAFAGDLAPCP